jgi:cyclophilin family peptidyl-prolyl cis-trans isomerase
MSKDKRDRQKDNRRARLEAEAAAWRTQQRNRRIFAFVLIAAVIGLGVLAVSVLTRDEDDETAAMPPTTFPTATTVPSNASTPSLPTTVPGASITGETPCPPDDGSAERTTAFEQAPPMCIDPAKQYDAIVTTDVGAFTIELDTEAAPETVNNFVVLSRYHFYDGVAFHRVIPGFVVQGGDAVGNPPGSGSPGYAFADELPASVDDYVAGSVAMANSGPDTNGSQFFVWLGPDPLPGPAYSLFGQVTEGLDVVREIEAGGGPDGTPMVPHAITAVEIVERGPGETEDPATTDTSSDGSTDTPATTETGSGGSP